MFCDKYSIYFILCVVLSVSRCILNVMTNTFTKKLAKSNSYLNQVIVKVILWLVGLFKREQRKKNKTNIKTVSNLASLDKYGG